MRCRRVTLGVAVLCVLLLVSMAVHAAGATHLAASVAASGGGSAASASYRVDATLGQGSAAGLSQSATYTLVGGYVPRAPLLARVRLPLVSAP
jgi:hypothetical protein